jgi:fibronectin-binding autotransporter adhesin
VIRRARALTRHRRRMTRLAVLVSACTFALLGGILAWAYVSGVSGAQTNTFSAAAVDHITISPSTASITAGGSQAYSDTALDASNGPFGTVTSTSSFSISPDGSCTGNSCTASVPGDHTVTAHFWGLTAGATLTVLSNDGSGVLASNVANVANGSTGNTIVLTYTAATGGLSGGEVDVAVPAGWTAPRSSNAVGCTTVSAGSLSFSGQTVRVNALTLAAGGTLTVTYGAQSGGACAAGDGATATTTAGPATWQGQEKSTAGGTLASITSPSINVYAADGSGTLATTTGNVSASSHNNTIAFTYTAAAAGGMSGGEVDLAVPSGWSAPVASNTLGCTTVSAGTLSFSGQTIKVSGLTLAAGGTLTVTYGAQSGGACANGDGATASATAGAQTWQGQQRSTPGGTLAGITSPSITVFAADGSGTLTTTTTTIANGSTGNTVAFTYTAAAGGVSNGEVDVAVPGGWTAPVTTNSAGCTTVSTGTLSISGSTIRVSALTLAGGGTLTVTYGATSGAPCTAGGGATAPTVAGAATWQGQETSTSGGTLASVSPSPSITVLSANGSGTLTTATTGVSAGSTQNGISFTYTAATGGMSGGSVTVAVPAGWTAPVITSAPGCVSATVGTVATSGQTITVSGLSLAAGSSTVITYGATSGGACTAGDGATATATTGAASWQGQEKSTAGGSLVTLGASPSITVFAADGSGTLGAGTANVNNGSTGTTIAFTYTAATGGISGGEVDVAVPAGWTPPAITNVIGCTTASTGTVSVSGQTVKVSGVTLGAGGTLTVTYGALSGGSCGAGDGAKASTTAGAATWQGSEKSTAGGALANLAASPSINVYAADGSGALTTTTTTVNASSTGNTIAFTYTAATGGFSGGEVDIVVPTGWTPPVTTNAIGCTTASTGTLGVTGQTIKVTGVTLAASGTLTVTYGATSGGACTAADVATATSTAGAQTWQGSQRSTAGGTLTSITSPSITVNGSMTVTSPTTTTPAHLHPNTSGQAFTITGTGFAVNVTVSLSDTHYVITNVNRTSSASITVTVNDTYTNSGTNAADLTVSNPGGGSVIVTGGVDNKG